jgi:Xaa-Pro aminopeptidase
MIPRIKRLQQYLSELKLDGLLIPKTDAHRFEFTQDHDNYLKFVTGFTGSAGFAIVLVKSAAVFVDGRYTLQAEIEVDSHHFACKNYTHEEICKWIHQQMKLEQILAYDPLLFSEKDLHAFDSCCREAGIRLTPVDENPIDHIWARRPKKLKLPLDVHPLIYSGEAHEDKIIKICEIMKQSNAGALFLNSPEAIAWLLNIRCPQRPYVPVAPCYFFLSIDRQGVLFIDDDQVPNTVRSHLGNSVVIKPYNESFAYLQDAKADTVIMMDPAECSVKAFNVVGPESKHILRKANPCQMLKACKNSIEIQGARHAHIRDGAAVVNFLAWLHQEGLEPGVTELEAAQKLLEFRQQQPLFMGLSFETIAGSGPNSAIIHYRVNESTNRTLQPDELFLLDSGGQYLDGTTDITRTVSLNKNPTAEQQDRFTRVLKGHMAIAKTIFPAGTTGSQLDALARQFLWEIGCDYAHGTGHGVGAYLGVHEGPQSITSRPSIIPLFPGMILSNEPGYYKKGEYGIRIESLVLVKEVENPSDEMKKYQFETLSAAPIDLSLINMNMLTSEERTWVNHYHKWVREVLAPYILPSTRPWLDHATREI